MTRMSAGTTNDLSDAIAAGGDEPVRATWTDAATEPTAPKTAAKRTAKKRPRPCFDDGSLTRVFKFPSRAYPRSSHYVTGDEIIVRIKKGRKKWKLVVPKKRVAAYRTNRWFAKKRWVEIELTFTQASRFGLVPPRSPSLDTSAVTALQTEIVTEPDTVIDTGEADATGAPHDPEWTAAEETVLELASEPADDEQADGGVDGEIEVEVRDDGENVADSGGDDDTEADDQADLDAALAFDSVDVPIEASSFETDTETKAWCGIIESEPLPESVAVRPPPVQAVAADRSRGGKARQWAKATVLSGASALVLASAAGVWLTPGGQSRPEVAEEIPTCTYAGSGTECADAIVTGSVGQIDDRQEAELPQSTTSEALASPPLVTGAGISQAPAIEVEAKIEASPSNGADGAPDEQASVDDGDPPTLAASPGTSPSLPQHASLPGRSAEHRDASLPGRSAEHRDASLPGRSAEHRDASAELRACRALGDFASAIAIRFDYASASLDASTRTLLNDFAGQMQSCPSALVIIEGHTDSDGHSNRNQTLSWRRAETVRRHLIDAGASPERLSAFGFGQSRPYEPNVSTENKRRNRRAALAVEIFR